MKLPREVKLTGGGRVELAAKPAEADAVRRFSMLAYTGDEISFYGTRVVFDLAGMKAASQTIPILNQHDVNKIAGMSDSVAITEKEVKIEGALSKSTKTGKKIAQLADEGFPWQASVGLEPSSVEDIKAGATVKLNGRTFQGPLLAVRKSVLRESSFCPLGRDGDTKSVVLSAFDGKEPDMPTEEEKKVMQDLTVTEFKAAAPKLYDTVRAEALREDSERRSQIGAAIKASLLPDGMQGQLMLRCQAMDLAAAQKEIDRTTSIEAALTAGKANGLDDKDITAIRGDVADLPLSAGLRLVASFVDAKKATLGRVVTGGPEKGSEKTADQIALEGHVKAAIVEFETIKASQPALKAADYVSQYLRDNKIKADDAALKAAAPDLFK